MTNDQVMGALTFLGEAERLKDVLRSSHTSTGRRESTAEHTWRLCLMAVVFEDAFDGIDFAKLLKICVIHDLGEALNGDVPAVEQGGDAGRSARERADLRDLAAALDEPTRAGIMALWDDYEGASSPEGVLAKGLDKLETILQHTQGRNPEDFDYEFNLAYGRERTSAHPLLAAIRDALDQRTRARLSQQGRPSPASNTR